MDSETQSAFTKDEWFAKNDWLADTGSATYTIQSVDMDDSSQESFAYVAVLLTFQDGSTSIRNTYFVYEDGLWKHRFSPEEYDLLATVPAGTSSVSTSVSTPATAEPSGGSAPPISKQDCPQSALIKGNVSSSGELIYHTQSSATYDETFPEACFATEDDAQAAGYREARD